MAKTLEELRKKYSPSAKVEKETDKLDALREKYSPSAKAQAESKKQVVLPEIPSSPVVQEGKVQRTINNPRFQTVAERAENKPTSTNVRAKGNSGMESTSRVGKAAQSIGLNTVGSVQMMGDTLEKAGENAEAYQQDSGLKDRADKALNDIKLARTLYGEDSEQYRQANAAYEAIRQEIVDYQNAPDKAVPKDSRGYQTMLKAQQLQQEALEGTSGVGRFLGETAFSVADNLATVIASGGNPMLAATMMGVKAAAGKAMELTDAGVNASSAFTRGAFSGAIEAATEKIPVDNLMDLVKAGGKNLLVNVLKQAGVEGTEEGFSYLFNYLADKLAQDPNAQFNPNDLLKQIASGAVSGLVFGAGGTAVNAMGVQQTEADPVMEQAVQMLQQKMGAMQAPAVQEMARPAANEAQAMQTPAAVQTPAAAPVRNAQEMAEDRKRVSEYAAALGENGSKALTAAYSSESVSGKYKPEEIVHGFYNAYNQSMTGKKLNAEGQKRVAALPETVRYMAESAGAEDARRAKQATYFGENAKLVRDDNWKQANLSYKTSRNLDSLAKVLGVKIRFTDKIVVDTDGNEANAQYQNGEIVISRNTELPVMTAAIHESVHRLREVSPEAYTELSGFVMEHMSELGKNFNLDYRAALYQTQNRDVLTEEMIADAYGVMLESSDMLEQFAREHTTVLQRLADGIRDILRKIKNATSLEDLKLDKAEKDAFFELQDQMKGMEQAMRNALKKAEANNPSDAATKNATQKSDVLQTMYKLKDSDASGVKEQLRGNINRLNEMEPVADIDVPTSFGKTMGEARKWISDQLKATGYRVERADIGTVIFDEKRLNTSLDYIDSPAEIAAYAALPRVLKRGVRIGGHDNHKGREYGTVTFAAPVVLNGKRGNMAAVVKMTNHNYYKVHRILMPDGTAYELESKKNAESTPAWGVTKTGSLAAPINSADTTVAQHGKNVKFSLKDSEGRKLSEEQQAFFAHSSSPDIRYSLKREEEVGIAYDAKTESVSPQYSLKTWKASSYVQARKETAKEMATALGIPEKKALAYIDSVNSIAKIIADDKVRLDYEASPGRSSFVSNTEYGGSIDFSTVCKKRRLFTGTFEAIQKALPNTALTADEFLEIRSMMDKKGYEVSCGLCYVEGSRANMGQYAKQFLEEYKATKPKYVPNMAEINTPNGLEKTRMEHPEVYAAYEKFMNGLAQRKPKLYQLHTEYQGEILNKFRKKNSSVETKNQNGGLRIQSFSDFEIVHLLDMMQVVMDMSQVGLAGQAYTKVPDFAWALGDTGLKINLSLIAKGVDSKDRLILDEKEGMSEKDAMALRDRYSENVGTIIVVFTDRQLKAAMADERIDYIIPFHRIQWNSAQYEAMGLPSNAKDFTLWQNEAYIKPVYNKNGKKQRPANYMPNTYWDFSKSGKENAEAYLKLCAENNRRPKFHYLLVNNGDGSYSLQPDGSTDGYWKTLIDFKMYDNSGKGSPQLPVRPDFNMEQAELMLREYTGGHGSFPAAQDVVDEFVAKYKENHPGQQYSRSNRELLNNMIRQYGAIEPGENPFRSVSVPKQTEEGKNVSKTVRTIMEAEATPEAMLPDVEALVADGTLSFESYTDEQAIADAAAKLKDKGWAKAYAQWEKDITRGVVSKENTVTGWTLYNNAANSGDTAMALDILQKMVGHQRNAAQALQATRVLKKLSPEAQLYGVQRSVQDLQDELNERYGVEGAPQLKVDETLAEEFMQAQTEEERDEALQKIYRDIGKQMPSRFVDKWDAWRYLAMLGNPRTHVRNIVGNAGFAPLVATKNLTATAIESAVNRVTGGKVGRTKALVLGGKNSRALLQAAWEDYAKVASVVAGEGKYSDLQKMNKAIDEGREIFKTKALEAARKANSAAMEAEDAWFSKPHYAAALASYCKANGIKPEQIAKGGKVVDRARAYAIKEAQKATYRDTNMLSELFGEIGGRWRYDKRNRLKRGVGTLIEGVLPFRKTPANILARGVEYSPIGLMNGIKKAVWDVQNGKATAAEAIDNISAGLTGTGLMLLGVYLAAQGLVRGRGEEDEKEREFAELQGHQAYSMELPNGTSVTLDWLAPEALPFFVGVNFWEMTDGATDKPNMDSIWGAVTSVTEPMLELSCLQSLNDLIESVSYAKNNDLNSVVAMIVSAATSYLTQALPTLGGQIERSAQKERMTTYTDKNKWISKDLQYTLGSASARIPGVDYNQIPYIDAWGRTESTGTTAGNAFNNFLNPSYTNKIETSAMEEELLRLYHATAEGTFPTGNVRYVGSGDNRKHLTAEEYVQYNTENGQTAYNLLEDLTNSKLYETANDEQKLELVGDVYTYANQIARAGVQEEYTPDKWVQAARNAESVGMSETEYFLYRLALEMVDTNNSVSQEDAQNAINKMSGLNKKQKSYLWQSTNSGWKDKNNPYK